MKKAILDEMENIIVAIANAEEKRIGIEEKNFITGRLVTLSNILKTYLTK